MLRGVGRRVAVLAGGAAVLAGSAGALLWPGPGQASAGGDPRGSWAMRFDAEVGPTTETVLGTLEISEGGACRMVLRMNVGGIGPADKSSSECSWRWLASHPAIGEIRATLPGNERAAFEFVLGDKGRRMFLMLTAPPGFPSSGEAVRR